MEIGIPFISDNWFKLNFEAQNIRQTMSVIIQDTAGRMMWEGQFQLSETNDNIEIDLSGWDYGAYHAWIEVAGKTYIRPFTIDKKTQEGILSKFRQFFS